MHGALTRVRRRCSVVFPEGGTGYFQANLNGSRVDLEKYAEVVPNVDGGVPAVTPCTDPAFIAGSQLKTLSCAARDNKVYVLLNMADLQPCSPGSGAGTPQGVCPDDGMYLYVCAMCTAAGCRVNDGACAATSFRYDASEVFSPTGQVRWRGCGEARVDLTCFRADHHEVLEVQLVQWRFPFQSTGSPETHNIQHHLWSALWNVHLL